MIKIQILIILLIMTGIFIFVCGLVLKPLKIISDIRYKKESGILDILEKICSKYIIKSLLQFLIRLQPKRIKRLSSKILELSEAGLTLLQLHFLKSVCLILCTLTVLVVCYTNADYLTNRMSELPGMDTVLYQNNASPGILSENQSGSQLYNKILNKVGRDTLSKADITQRHYIVEKAVAECLNTIDQKLLMEKTEWFLKVWEKSKNFRTLKYFHFILIILSAFVPEIMLTLRWILRGCIYKKEIIKLEYIFGLLVQVDGIKTLDIIHEMQKASKIYAKYLKEFAIIFQFDRQKGFDYLKSINIKSINKLANVLEIYSLSDRELALQILEREVMERDESLIITAEETVDFIDLLAFMSIIPLVYEMAMLMLNPMLDLVYRTFEFI